MKILVANHHLVSFGGTEAFTLELAKGLKQKGHSVTVYSKFIDKLAPFLDREEIPYVSNLSLLQGKFDIAHVHHNISAIEVRSRFPNLPIFYLSHGALHFLEKPPKIDVNITQYGAVSEGIKQKMVESGIPSTKITVVNNLVDEKRFYSKRPLNQTPKKALILSAKIDGNKERIIVAACNKLKIKLSYVGGRFGEVAYYGIPRELNNADIVFTIGRGVVESMMCGRIPIVYDIFGGDGMVTETNFKVLQKRNFTGKVNKKQYNVSELIKEILKYNAGRVNKLQSLVLKNYSIETQVPKLLLIYEKTIKEYRDKNINSQSLQSYVQTINASIYYQARLKPSQLKRDYTENQQRLDEITNSKFFKLWPVYNMFKNKFFRK